MRAEGGHLMGTLRLYIRYIGVSLRSQFQYKASLAMLFFGYALGAIMEYFAIFTLINRFGGMGNWSFEEIGLFYGMSCAVFALCEAWMRGFFMFHYTIRDAEFDRVLVRPRSTVLQIMGSGFQLLRLGRTTVGVLVIIWAFTSLNLQWTWAQWALFFLSMIGGVLLFSGIVLIQATSCFWTVETLEAFNIVTYGGVETVHYPLDVYGKRLKEFFMYIVPLAAVNYWPCSVLLGKGYVPWQLAYASPLIGLFVFAVGIAFWRFGVRHYRSTGS